MTRIYIIKSNETDSKYQNKKVIKKPFTDEDLEKLRVNCKNERDLAIVDFYIQQACVLAKWFP